MSKFDLDVLHQTISDTQSNICQAVIVKEEDREFYLGRRAFQRKMALLLLEEPLFVSQD